MLIGGGISLELAFSGFQNGLCLYFLRLVGPPFTTKLDSASTYLNARENVCIS